MPELPARLNLARFVLEDRLAEGPAAAAALLEPERATSYGALAERVARATAGLRSVGVGRGARVLLLYPDGLDFATGLFALLGAGAAGVMVNPELPMGDLDAIVRYVQPSRVLGDPALLGHAPALAAMAQTVPSLLAGSGGSAEDTHGDEEALWLLSSGSTEGRPRAVIHRHRDFAFHVAAFARPILHLGPEDVTYAVPRLHFPYATGMNLLYPLYVGARAVTTPERPTPERVYEVVDRFGVTVLSTVPTMTAKLLACEARPAALPSLRLVVSAGEALPPALHRRWLETFGVEMLDGIGSAEMFHMYLANRIGDTRPGTLGVPVPGYALKIVRDDDSEAAPFETGVLWVRGASAGVGYHDDEERTQAVFREDGWVVSGDCFHRDADGRYVFDGRADDILKVSGLYVSPLEVERAVASHPAVEECAVVGHPDGDGLVKPRAFVVAPGGVDSSELEAWARERLASYKVPRSWVFVPALPRNDRGKIVRRALREAGKLRA